MSTMAEDDTSDLIHNLTICLIGAATAGVVVTIYHCITASHIRAILSLGGRHRGNTSQRRTFMPNQDQITQSSIESSIAELIPSHKYQKGKGLIREEDDGMCAVCLSDFEEGEEIRTLPECMHSFHAPCIDMWLFSHSNCPMCRTIATPSPSILLHLLDSNSDGPATPQDHNISPLSRV